MRPIGDAPHVTGHRKAAEHLQTEPDAQHDPSRDREDAEKDNEDEQHIDAGLGVKQQIAPHYPCNGPRGTDHRHEGGRVCRHLCQSGGKPRQKIEGQEPDMAHLIFEIIAKDPQKQHVAQKMQPSGMQKHGGHDGGPALPLRQRGGHQTPDLEEAVNLITLQRCPIAKKDKGVERDQPKGDIGRAARRVVVTDREHGIRVSDARFDVKGVRGAFAPLLAGGPITPRAYLAPD